MSAYHTPSALAKMRAIGLYHIVPGQAVLPCQAIVTYVIAIRFTLLKFRIWCIRVKIAPSLNRSLKADYVQWQPETIIIYLR